MRLHPLTLQTVVLLSENNLRSIKASLWDTPQGLRVLHSVDTVINLFYSLVYWTWLFRLLSRGSWFVSIYAIVVTPPTRSRGSRSAETESHILRPIYHYANCCMQRFGRRQRKKHKQYLWVPIKENNREYSRRNRWKLSNKTAEEMLKMVFWYFQDVLIKTFPKHDLCFSNALWLGLPNCPLRLCRSSLRSKGTASHPWHYDYVTRVSRQTSF